MGPLYLTKPLMYWAASIGLSTTVGNFIETSSESTISQIAGKIFQQPASVVFLMASASSLDLGDVGAGVALITPLLTYGMQKIANLSHLPKLEKFFSVLDRVLTIAGKVMSCAIIIFGYYTSTSIASPLSFLFLGLFALNAVLYTKQLTPYFYSSKDQVNS
ncbi:MAG: hypothetical protein PVI40_00485 [Chlamydiota bacterium]|jgi:hypothetical protein